MSTQDLADIRKIIDYSMAKTMAMYPLEDSGTHLILACADRPDIPTHKRLRFLLRRDLVYRPTDAAEVLAAIETSYTPEEKQICLHASRPMDTEQEALAFDLSAGSGATGAVRLVNDLFTKAVQSGASDIHLEPNTNGIRARYRLDGVLYELANLGLDQKDAVLSRVKIMANLDIAEKRRPQDGRILIESGTRRCSAS